MAINFTGTRVVGAALSEAKADGYTPPIVTQIAGTKGDYRDVVQVQKSSVEDADPVVTWQNIYTELDIVGVAFSGFFDGTTNTVNSYGEVSSITLVDDPKYGNVAPYYEFEYVLRTDIVVP